MATGLPSTVNSNPLHRQYTYIIMCSGSHRFTLRDLNATTFGFPPLDTWAEQHLSAIVTAHSQAELQHGV